MGAPAFRLRAAAPVSARILAGCLLAGCGTTSNFETAKLAAPGDMQVYGHASRYAALGDSATVNTGVVEAFGGSLVFGLSRRWNLRAGYERVRVGPSFTYSAIDDKEFRAEGRDHVLLLDAKAGKEGDKVAASFGLRRLFRSRVIGLLFAGYYNFYPRPDLYFCVSPYAFTVMDEDEISWSTTAAVNFSVTWEILGEFFVRPEAGMVPLPSDDPGWPANVGLAAGFLF